MKRFTPPPWSLVVLLILFAVSNSAQQIQTGNIFGKAQAKDGSLLPGVTVTITGVGAPQTFVTDGQGNFRFLNLSPGSYTIKGELAGYGTATHSGITVSLGSNNDVVLTLSPSVAESITVTADAPLLDTRRTGTGATVTKVELEQIPTGRDPWVILQQTPGVLMDRLNVGGSESGQQSNYVGKGAGGEQATWNVDGVNITDVGSLGSSPTYYDFDSIEEMQVTTGGTDIRIQTPGVQLNMVTKRGTNDLRASARFFNTSGDMQSDPEIPSEARNSADVLTGRGYLDKSNAINRIDDWGLEIGGPIIRDKLWLWGAYANQQINLLTATSAVEIGETQYDQFRDETLLKTLNGKLNWQILTNNSFTAIYNNGEKIKLGRNVGPLRPPETAYNQNGPTPFWKLEDTHIFGPNFYLTGVYSHLNSIFNLIADNGRGCSDFTCGLSSEPAWFDEDGVAHRSYLSYSTERPQDQMRLDASSFFATGSVNHELKFGFGYRNAPVTSTTAWPAGYYLSYYEGGANPQAGDTGGVGFFRQSDIDYEVDSTDLYVGDTMLFGNLTLQAGLRWDRQRGTLNPGEIAANPVIPTVLPAISFRGSADVGELEWTSISPRLGLTYTLGSEKKTLLRAAANRYVDQVGGSTVYGVSPLGYQYLYYDFVDVNGNRRVEFNEIDFELGAYAWFGIDPEKSTTAQPVKRWDEGFDAPYTDELILGFEHELRSDFTVGANVTFRKLNNFIEERLERTPGSGDFYTRADYEEAGFVRGRLPDGTSYEVPWYDVPDAGIYYVFRNRPDYHQTYRGLELNGTKRMNNRWMLRANLSWNDWKQHVGDEANADPTRLRDSFGCNSCDGGTVVQGSGTGSGAKGGIYINSRWSYNVTGVYQIPVVEMALGFAVTGREGYAIPWAHRVTSNEGFKYVLIEDDPAASRHSDLHNLDLRLAKDFRVYNRAGITISAELFNVFNSNTIMQRNTRLGRGGTNDLYDPVARPTRLGNQITEIQSPRVIRVGARLTF